MDTIDVNGGQGVVVVRPGSRATAAQIGWGYLWTRVVRPSRHRAYLDHLSVVQFYPAPYDVPAVQSVVRGGGHR